MLSIGQKFPAQFRGVGSQGERILCQPYFTLASVGPLVAVWMEFGGQTSATIRGKVWGVVRKDGGVRKSINSQAALMLGQEREAW